jgi:sarcosine oxidase
MLTRTWWRRGCRGGWAVSPGEGAAGEPLIDTVGTVVSGDRVGLWSSAMAAAGSDHEVVEEGSALLRLPTRRLAGQALVDSAGGVIRVDRVGAFLVAAAGSRLRRARVDGIEETRGRVRVWSGEMADDAAVICAGTGTSTLAARAAIDTPSALEHHVRFSLPVRSEAPGPL